MLNTEFISKKFKVVSVWFQINPMRASQAPLNHTWLGELTPFYITELKIVEARLGKAIEFRCLLERCPRLVTLECCTGSYTHLSAIAARGKTLKNLTLVGKPDLLSFKCFYSSFFKGSFRGNYTLRGLYPTLGKFERLESIHLIRVMPKKSEQDQFLLLLAERVRLLREVKSNNKPVEIHRNDFRRLLRLRLNGISLELESIPSFIKIVNREKKVIFVNCVYVMDDLYIYKKELLSKILADKRITHFSLNVPCLSTSLNFGIKSIVTPLIDRQNSLTSLTLRVRYLYSTSNITKLLDNLWSLQHLNLVIQTIANPSPDKSKPKFSYHDNLKQFSLRTEESGSVMLQPDGLLDIMEKARCLQKLELHTSPAILKEFGTSLRKTYLKWNELCKLVVTVDKSDVSKDTVISIIMILLNLEAVREVTVLNNYEAAMQLQFVLEGKNINVKYECREFRTD